MHRFVPTDAEGVQHLEDHRRAWPLPGGGSPGSTATAAEGEHDLVLLDDDELLDVLGERLFLAERLDAGQGPSRSARLVRELPFGPRLAAEFALDCADHARARIEADRGEEPVLEDGSSLADLIAEARRYLESAGESDDRRLGRLARLAAARRLGREQARVAGLAFAALADDEDSDVDIFDDPRWNNLAALSSALLACVEVIRHVALPRYVAARERGYALTGTDRPEQPFVTPWGPVEAFASHLPAYVPAYVSARQAAERARQAVSDQEGEAAGTSERAWQRRRLLELIGVPAEV